MSAAAAQGRAVPESGRAGRDTAPAAGERVLRSETRESDGRGKTQRVSTTQLSSAKVVPLGAMRALRLLRSLGCTAQLGGGGSAAVGERLAFGCVRSVLSSTGSGSLLGRPGFAQTESEFPASWSCLPSGDPQPCPGRGGGAVSV